MINNTGVKGTIQFKSNLSFNNTHNICNNKRQTDYYDLKKALIINTSLGFTVAGIDATRESLKLKKKKDIKLIEKIMDTLASACGGYLKGVLIGSLAFISYIVFDKLINKKNRNK